VNELNGKDFGKHGFQQLVALQAETIVTLAKRHPPLRDVAAKRYTRRQNEAMKRQKIAYMPNYSVRV
jgi:hypothetical protein